MTLDAGEFMGLSGSLRRGCFNTAVLRAGGSLMPADSELRIESIEGIPLYNVSVRARHLARARYSVQSCCRRPVVWQQFVNTTRRVGR